MDYTWTCGIQTCPRLGCDLPTTLESVRRAGWYDFTVFGEPGTEQIHPNQVVWPYQFGDWGSWFSALSCMHATRPHADFFVMFEDDIALCRNIRPYLESFLSTLPNFGTFNLYTPERHHSTFGRKPCVTDESWFGWEMWGAQGVVFSRDSLRTFLGSTMNLEYRNSLIGSTNAHKDSAIGMWGRATGHSIYYHSPSMVQHLHLSSLIGSGPHQAFDFVGCDFDASQWIGKGPTLALAKCL